MKQCLWVKALVVATACLIAGPVMAGDDDDKKVPNVLIVKVKVDQTGQQTQDGAQVIPVSVNLQRDSQGQVDKQKMVQDADQAASQAQQIPLQSDQYDQATLPDAVKQKFDKADQDSTNELLNWRWWYPYSYYRGWYGYGHYPYYGYYSYYPSYYPYYGYYYNNYTYGYNWGWSRPYGGWYYNYYYR